MSKSLTSQPFLCQSEDSETLSAPVGGEVLLRRGGSLRYSPDPRLVVSRNPFPSSQSGANHAIIGDLIGH